MVGRLGSFLGAPARGGVRRSGQKRARGRSKSKPHGRAGSSWLNAIQLPELVPLLEILPTLPPPPPVTPPPPSSGGSAAPFTPGWTVADAYATLTPEEITMGVLPPGVFAPGVEAESGGAPVQEAVFTPDSPNPFFTWAANVFPSDWRTAPGSHHKVWNDTYKRWYEVPNANNVYDLGSWLGEFVYTCQNALVIAGTFLVETVQGFWSIVT